MPDEPIDQTPGDEAPSPPAVPDPAADAVRAALRRARAAARTRDAAPPPVRGSGRSPSRGTDRVGIARSGAGPDDRDPQPLGRAVSRLVRERGWSEAAAVGGVVGRWVEIVGPDIAAHAVVEGFDDGRLLVRASSTAWATQLRLMVGTLRTRLDAELGADVVRSVTILGPAAPSWRKGPRHVQGRGPRDTFG